MPRPKTHTADTLADRALTVFWSRGYNATSMDDLVRATKVSRHGIYSDFGGKRELFLACFQRYQELVVSPAFEAVERPGAGLSEIANYFEHQIARAEEGGLPGPGCFVANAATEAAPHDGDVLKQVEAHNDRLRRGFSAALKNALPEGMARDGAEIERLAETVLIFATGLWSLSRVTASADRLRKAARTFLSSLERQLT